VALIAQVSYLGAIQPEDSGMCRLFPSLAVTAGVFLGVLCAAVLVDCAASHRATRVEVLLGLC
jgi:hypothetical protein